jgi:hypothetical protein
VARYDLFDWLEKLLDWRKFKPKELLNGSREIGFLDITGAPLSVTVDGGSEFSQQFKQTLKEKGINVKVTTAYYPEANEMVKRGHQALKDALVKLCAQEGKK